MNCPHCNAKIEENARFCIYCMTPLEEKEAVAPLRVRKKRWWLIAAAALLVLLLCLLVWRLWPQKAAEEPALPDTPAAEQQEEAPTVDTPAVEPPTIETPTEKPPTVDTPSARPEQKPAEAPQQSGNETPAVQEQPKAEQPPAEEAEPSQPPAEEPQTPEPEEQTPGVAEAEYYYRDAKYGDDYHVNAYVDDAVVITGIKTPAADGIYRLPSELGGKRVIAVMGLTFFNSGQHLSVKKVVVPASIRTIWDYAFEGCVNLTDIYFCGESIYVSNWAFPALEKRSGTLTIHCSQSCNNRDLRYYKNIAADYYDAVFKEWDGGAL